MVLRENGLAAGIGACDYKRIEILAQLKAYGDGLILWQQRMARTAQHRSPLSQLRLYPVELIRKLRLGKNNVELDEKIVVGSNVVGVLGAVGGKLRQYALDFRFLLCRQLTQLVIRLHSGHRLDEKRRSRC